MTQISLAQRLAELAAQSVKTASGQAIAIGEAVMSGEYELVRVAEGPQVELPSEDKEVSSLVEAAVALAHERGEKLRALRRALEQGASESALLLAREVCGLKGVDDEASDRAASRIH